MQTCSVQECDRAPRSRGGMCNAHYRRQLKHGNIDPDRPVRGWTSVADVPKTKACEHCGLKFPRPSWCGPADWQKRRFCSRRCAVHHNQRGVRWQGKKKVCSNCGIEKPLDAFSIRRDGKGRGGRASWCKRCASDHAMAWNRSNPERFRKNARTHRLKKAYGLSRSEYETMLKQQGGLCAICRDPTRSHTLAVDHDHSSGTIRGLLCQPCNRALGFLRDDPDLMTAALAYLRR